jgi:PAS domain-containing protein
MGHRCHQAIRSMLHAAPDAMLVVNSEGSIVVANFQPAKLSGY